MNARWWWMGLLVPALTLAANISTPVELRMVVTGTIDVNTDGSVKGYTLDNPDKLPAAVHELLKTTLPDWKFAPIGVDGNATPMHTRVSVSVVGKVVDDSGGDVAGKQEEQQHRVQIQVADVQLACPPPRGELLSSWGCQPVGTIQRLPGSHPPMFPLVAVKQLTGGMVYLWVEIDHDGRVAKVAVRRVDLFKRASHPDVIREAFADGAIQAARGWRFSVHVPEPATTRDHWIVEQAIKYYIDGDHVASLGYGQWLACLPGAVRAIPWAGNESHKMTRLPQMTVTASLVLDPKRMLYPH